MREARVGWVLAAMTCACVSETRPGLRHTHERLAAIGREFTTTSNSSTAPPLADAPPNPPADEEGLPAGVAALVSKSPEVIAFDERTSARFSKALVDERPTFHAEALVVLEGVEKSVLPEIRARRDEWRQALASGFAEDELAVRKARVWSTYDAGITKLAAKLETSLGALSEEILPWPRSRTGDSQMTDCAKTSQQLAAAQGKGSLTGYWFWLLNRTMTSMRPVVAKAIKGMVSEEVAICRVRWNGLLKPPK